ncbi:MAG TPA: hypothetical protein PLV36_19180, partial [Zoogloea sp.]|nr:hypothetical protein [Zoogloea sp.]
MRATRRAGRDAERGVPARGGGGAGGPGAAGVAGTVRGYIEVYYLEERPSAGEGPFLTDERNLIDDIARSLGEMV